MNCVHDCQLQQQTTGTTILPAEGKESVEIVFRVSFNINCVVFLYMKIRWGKVRYLTEKVILLLFYWLNQVKRTFM